MNNDLISREALIKELTDAYFYNETLEMSEIKQIIDNALTVDPVCWNCEHFGEKAVTGHCIKCRDKDMWELKKGGADMRKEKKNEHL